MRNGPLQFLSIDAIKDNVSIHLNPPTSDLRENHVKYDVNIFTFDGN